MNAVCEGLSSAAASGLLPPDSSILLAVSGGADSMALLHGAADAAPEAGWRLSVGHVHHGWRGREADRDLAYVEEHARRLGLPFAERHRDARAASQTLGLSPEAGARLVRYEALHEIAAELGARTIATAHQQDDVLESHLLARLRRGGLALLAGPREIREDGVVRPLLGVSRAEILDFLSARDIAHRRDASNGDLRLLRSRVRRELAEMGPEARTRLAGEIASLRALRSAVEAELSETVLPHVRSVQGSALVAAALLEEAGEDVARAALERLAAPFARPGRPPFTGGEREQILRRLASGKDFRFEAGRRIRFERRGPTFRVRLSPAASAAGAVYDSPIDTLDSDARAAS
jgi:tRNA(Ile)-lysidine synthase